MDWKEIALLVAFLLFAVLMAHGWPDGDWQVGWGMIGAVSTAVIGFAAFRISRKQTLWLEERRRICLDIFDRKVRDITSMLYVDLHSTAAQSSLRYKTIQDYSNLVSLAVCKVREASVKIDELISNLEFSETPHERYESIVEKKEVMDQLYRQHGKINLQLDLRLWEEVDKQWLYEEFYQEVVKLFSNLGSVLSSLEVEDKHGIQRRFDDMKTKVLESPDVFYDFVDAL